jgi:VIT1/CCC1 family predicted Fe2+/Mn2+ transporter
VSAISTNNAQPGLARANKRKWPGGNALRAAVLGANDGLVSNLSLVMGVAGAQLDPHAIVVTGLAGLLAGASSMALGEWLSVQSSRELYTHQITLEASNLDADPGAQQERLSAIYERKGLPRALSGQVAAYLLRDKRQTLDTLAREHIGVDPDELGGSAWEAAGMSFALFAVGAIVPVLPFLFLTGLPAIIVSMLVSALALFITGACITLVTGRNPLFSGFRQVLFGTLAALLTFGIGRLVGVTFAP